MNNNAIVSLAMLYALWESKQQDLLGVIRPVSYTHLYLSDTGEPRKPSSVYWSIN